MTVNNAELDVDHAGLSPLKAFGLLLAVIPLIAGFIIICSLIGNADFYTGFIFLLCWTGFEQGKVETLPKALLGSALGLALSYSMHALMSGPLGLNGGYVFGLLALTIVYFQLLGMFSICINFCTMTFLAVLTIPHVQMHGNFLDMAIALLIGAVYFGLILGGISYLSTRNKKAGV